MLLETIVMRRIKEFLHNKNNLVQIYYFIVGIILSFPSLAYQYYFYDTLILSPTTVTSFYGILMIPWLLKPILGIITDSFPIFGYKRRPYLIFSSFSCFLCFIIMGTYGLVDIQLFTEQKTVLYESYYEKTYISSDYNISSGAFVNELYIHDDKNALLSVQVIQLVLIFLASFFLAFTDFIIDSIMVEQVLYEELNIKDENHDVDNNSIGLEEEEVGKEYYNNNDFIDVDIELSNFSYTNEENEDDNNIDVNNKKEQSLLPLIESYEYDEDSEKQHGDKVKYMNKRNINVNKDDENYQLYVEEEEEEEGEEYYIEEPLEDQEEKNNTKSVGILQSNCTSLRIIGTIISSLLVGQLLEFIPSPVILLVTCIFPLSITFFSLFFLKDKHYSQYYQNHNNIIEKEKNYNHQNTNKNTTISDITTHFLKEIDDDQINDESLSNEQVNIHNNNNNNINSLLSQKILFWITLIFSRLKYIIVTFYRLRLYKPLFFICLIYSLPSYYTALFYYYNGPLGVTPSTFGIISFIVNISSLIGTIIYKYFLRKLNFRVIFIFSLATLALSKSTLFLIIFGIVQRFGIPIYLFLIIDSGVISLVSQFVLMPVIVLSARVCPKGIEAVIYATIVTSISLSGMISDMLSSFLMYILSITNSNFKNLWILILICVLSSLFPILFVKLVPSFSNESSNADDDINSTT
eukprot:TRINITY_DN5161_c0_g1_i1.p1 TRINITY_DN5161_c0_g1~~TRINITY_DN5161_c0_g1_i1.p1  ORF type:complete len:691 (-),score=123.92 TRINITY_DN5161_c0_g1_i1:1-2073(-)